MLYCVYTHLAFSGIEESVQAPLAFVFTVNTPLIPEPTYNWYANMVCCSLTLCSHKHAYLVGSDQLGSVRKGAWFTRVMVA